MYLEFVAPVIDFLRSISDVIWSGIIASGLTLSGVLISNRSNAARLRMQLDHDSVEKSKERIVSVRREIYLRATDESHKILRFFTNLPSVDFTEANPSEALHGFQSTLSKLKLIAEPKTISLVTSLDAEVSKVFLKLLGVVQPIHDTRTYIWGFDENIDFFRSKAKEAIAEIKALNESSASPLGRIEELKKSYEDYVSTAAKHKQGREVKQQEFDRLTEAYSKSIYSELTPLGRLMGQIEIEMRSELGLTTDVAAYIAQMERQRVEMGDLLNGTLAAMHSATNNSPMEEKNG